jgi:hypothetical protein
MLFLVPKMEKGIRTGVSSVDLTLPLPTVWTETGQIEKILLYPLKSAKGRVVQTAEVSKHFVVPGCSA